MKNPFQCLLLGAKYFLLASMGCGWLVLLGLALRLMPALDAAMQPTTAVFTMAGLSALAVGLVLGCIGVGGTLAWAYGPFPLRPELDQPGQSRCDQVR